MNVLVFTFVAENSVALVVDRSLPNPTGLRFLDLSPKVLFSILPSNWWIQRKAFTPPIPVSLAVPPSS
jgi:hypothetical protein